MRCRRPLARILSPAWLYLRRSCRWRRWSRVRSATLREPTSCPQRRRSRYSRKCPSRSCLTRSGVVLLQEKFGVRSIKPVREIFRNQSGRSTVSFPEGRRPGERSLGKGKLWMNAFIAGHVVRFRFGSVETFNGQQGTLPSRREMEIRSRVPRLRTICRGLRQ